jgi:hypothetical protein
MPLPRAESTPAVSFAPVRTRWGFAEIFVVSQTALPALLYLPGTQAFRLPIRVSAFAISLAAFAWWHLQGDVRLAAHKAYSWVAAVMALLTVMLFHPATSSVQGGLAHMAVYFSVMAPMFWAPVFVRTPEHLARLLAILLICSGVNSIVGVLQVYDPARWMPAEFSRLMTESAVGLGPVSYVGPNGQLIVRPPGLFDNPGAVAGPGMFAALLGAVFGLSSLALWKRIVALAMAGAGLAAIHLSQIWVSLVVTVVMFVLYAFALMRQGRVAKATTFTMLAAATIGGSFVLAVALGGQSILERFLTLFADGPMSVYYHARGVQLDYTLSELLYQFPLGAGLGRWGMAAGYFGTSNVPGLWAEIQITGWMIDGGVLMIVIYGGALVVTAISQLRLAGLTGHPKIAACAAVVFAAGIGTAAMVISYTPFVAQIGIQYWFLAGALHGVACHHRLQDA